MLDLADVNSVARRALDHQIRRTTDLADGVMRIPVEAYSDPAVWRHEIDSIFRRVPLALALSAELPSNGDFKTMDAVGLPVLLVRGRDGVVRSFLNVCRHRGAMVCEAERGNSRRFTCPYHAWVYDDEGRLATVARSDQFGDPGDESLGLKALPTQERFGIVWVCLDDTAAVDVDAWLGSFAPELERLELDRWTLHDQRLVEGPGWKVAFDGYLDGYHGAHLHSDSLDEMSPNLLVVDTYGPHERVVFALKSIASLRERPEEEWDAAAQLVPNHIVFPNVSIAGAWHDIAIVCVIMPGPSFDKSVTIQTVLTRGPAVDRRARAIARAFSGLMFRVVKEDYETGAGIQESLASGANTHFLLGRNELPGQHFHAWLDRLSRGEASFPPS